MLTVSARLRLATPAQFGRRTLRPYNGLVSLVAVAVAIVIFQRRLLLSNPHGRRD